MDENSYEREAEMVAEDIYNNGGYLPDDYDDYCAYVGSREWEEDYYGGFDN